MRDTDTGDLFSQPTGEDLRDRVLARVGAKNAAWMELVCGEVALLQSGFEGTGEDIKLAIRSRTGEPKHFNAWGAAIHACVARGLLAATGRGVKLKVATSHAHFSPIWRRP